MIRYCNEIGSAAHVELMRYAKPAMMEYQVSRPKSPCLRRVNPHYVSDPDLWTGPAQNRRA